MASSVSVAAWTHGEGGTGALGIRSHGPEVISFIKTTPHYMLQILLYQSKILQIEHSFSA